MLAPGQVDRDRGRRFAEDHRGHRAAVVGEEGQQREAALQGARVGGIGFGVAADRVQDQGHVVPEPRRLLHRAVGVDLAEGLAGEGRLADGEPGHRFDPVVAVAARGHAVAVAGVPQRRHRLRHGDGLLEAAGSGQQQAAQQLVPVFRPRYGHPVPAFEQGEPLLPARRVPAQPGVGVRDPLRGLGAPLQPEIVGAGLPSGREGGVGPRPVAVLGEVVGQPVPGLGAGGIDLHGALQDRHHAVEVVDGQAAVGEQPVPVEETEGHAAAAQQAGDVLQPPVEPRQFLVSQPATPFLLRDGQGPETGEIDRRDLGGDRLRTVGERRRRRRAAAAGDQDESEDGREGGRKPHVTLRAMGWSWCRGNAADDG